MIGNTQCERCRNHRPGTLTCEAFPSGIPADVLENERLHLEVFLDQVGTATWKSDGERPEYVPARKEAT